MPWLEQSAMSLREEFVRLAGHDEVPFAELCRRFGISRQTGYKWVRRDADDGDVSDRSRRPHGSPRQTPDEGVAAVLAVREAHPTWGARKIYHVVRDHRADVPAPSTIHAILQRHHRIDPARPASVAWHRFEHDAPNDLWQMDHMGHLALAQGRVHPLSILDDHSRFGLVLQACGDQQATTVKAILQTCFQQFGLPRAILTDNGPPWGTAGQGGLTALEAWFLRLEIDVRHGQPYHPQTQGKVERWHRTIGADVFQGRPPFRSLHETQQAFDAFRDTYNQHRPHAALAYAVPASRYTPSRRSFPATEPPVRHAPGDEIRLVRAQGAVSFQNRSHFISSGLIGQPVGIRPTVIDGRFTVHYCGRIVATIDLRLPDP
jgi:transposase InsO family protein